LVAGIFLNWRKQNVRKAESGGGGGETKTIRIMERNENRCTLFSVDGLM